MITLTAESLKLPDFMPFSVARDQYLSPVFRLIGYDISGVSSWKELHEIFKGNSCVLESLTTANDSLFWPSSNVSSASQLVLFGKSPVTDVESIKRVLQNAPLPGWDSFLKSVLEAYNEIHGSKEG